MDPDFALALTRRAVTFISLASEYEFGATARALLDKAHADAERALKLAPDLADAHATLASLFETEIEYRKAREEYARAVALAPGDARVLRFAGGFAASMGDFDSGIKNLRRAVLLDPLNVRSQASLGQGLFAARRYDEAIATLKPHLGVDPDDGTAAFQLGVAYLMKGDVENARKACESVPDFWATSWCLGIVYDRLGRRADSDRMVAKLRSSNGDGASYQYATIYAQRGDLRAALEWMETALRIHDPGLEYIKTDPLIDPLRKEPRFQAIAKQLDFPE